LCNLISESGGNGGGTPKRNKLTNREAILEVLREAGKPLPAPRIVSGLAGKGKYTTITTVRSDLSKGKRDGLFTNSNKGWTVTEKTK
jgi:Fe2+ or Zn2+ uptake regulation protein